MDKQLTKEEFIAFVNSVALPDAETKETEGDHGGYYFCINWQNDKPGRYRLNAIGPTGTTMMRYSVAASGIQQAAAEAYDLITPELPEPAAKPEQALAGPIRYEDLSDRIKRGLTHGDILAAHTVEGEGGLLAEHLTTVELIGHNVDFDVPEYYCNDVCYDDCEPGSVRLLMVEMPKERFAGHVTDTGMVRSDEGAQEVPSPSLLEDMSFLAGRLETFVEEWTALHLRLEAAVAAGVRLERLRDWTYERYRSSLLDGDSGLAEECAMTLFFIVTGLEKFRDDSLFGVFRDHLVDAVILHDAETMPEFQPSSQMEDETDCGA